MIPLLLISLDEIYDLCPRIQMHSFRIAALKKAHSIAKKQCMYIYPEMSSERVHPLQYKIHKTNTAQHNSGKPIE